MGYYSMIILVTFYLINSVLGYEPSTNQLEVRNKRQYSYQLYYICGLYPNQYISYTPCYSCSTCNPPNQCQVECRTDQFCQSRNTSWRCINGCCKASYDPPTPNPVCAGREVSGGYCRRGACDSGFLCTTGNICCRCAYGTSIGPCVNGKCPDNHLCNTNNECCPYEVGK